MVCHAVCSVHHTVVSYTLACHTVWCVTVSLVYHTGVSNPGLLLRGVYNIVWCVTFYLVWHAVCYVTLCITLCGVLHPLCGEVHFVWCVTLWEIRPSAHLLCYENRTEITFEKLVKYSESDLTRTLFDCFSDIQH